MGCLKVKSSTLGMCNVFLYSIRDVHAGDLLAHLENQNVNDLDLEIFVQMALRRTFFGPKVYTPEIERIDAKHGPYLEAGHSPPFPQGPSFWGPKTRRSFSCMAQGRGRLASVGSDVAIIENGAGSQRI